MTIPWSPETETLFAVTRMWPSSSRSKKDAGVPAITAIILHQYKKSRWEERDISTHVLAFHEQDLNHLNQLNTKKATAQILAS